MIPQHCFSRLLFLFLLQRCFLSYTGFNGKVHSTMQGHGWSDEGVLAFNANLEAVLKDREKLGAKFDKDMIEHCKRVIGGDNGNGAQGKRKNPSNSAGGVRAKCYKVHELKRRMKSGNSNNSNSNSNSNNNNSEDGNKDVETVVQDNMTVEDHLAD